MKRYILFYFLLVITGKTFSQKLKDTVFFKNGSIVIGEIKKIKLGVITVDPDDANDITVQLRNLKTLSAVSRIFRVETVKHDVYYGKLIPDDSNYVQLVHVADTSILLLQDVSIMYPFENAFLQRFSGNVGLGYSYTRSSDFGRINFNGSMTYTAQKDEVTVSASGIYTSTDSSFTRDNENFSSKYNFYFSPSWFATTFFSYQRNLELGLQRRYQEGFGFGDKFITSKNVYAWTRAGIVFNQEKSTENVTTGTLTELFGQLEFNFFKFTKPEISLDMTEALFYSLSQSGRFRNDGQLNLNWEIVDDLKVNLGFYNNYDSKPPVEGSNKLDFGVSFGLNYSF